MTGGNISDLHRRLRADADVVVRRVEDEIVVVHLGRNHVFSLNPTGARLWELIAEGCTPAEAIERMLGEFDVPETELRSEVSSFLKQLLREGLLVPNER